MAYCDYDDVYRKCGNISTDDIGTSVITNMITEADAYIERRLGKTWDTSSSFTDYFDVFENDYERDWVDEGGIVTGSKPFFDSRHQFVLRNKPVNSVTDVFVLSRSASFDAVYSFDSSASSYTDNLTEANSVGGTPFYAFASTVGSGDMLYIGCEYKFLALTINLVTSGVGGTCTWEYYDTDSSWSTLSVTEGSSGGDDLNASSKITWSLPRDWDETTVDDSSELYFVRVKVTSAHSTSPTVRNVFLDNNTTVYDEIEPYDYTWEREGRLVLREKSLTTDMNKLRVDYYAGRDAGSTFPNSNEEYLVQDLSATISAINVMVYLMGGSYDDPANYSIDDLQVGKGEPYTNLRATIHELEKRKEDLFNQIGVNVAFFAT